MDVTFWAHLGKTKLNHYKLNEGPFDIHGMVIIFLLYANLNLNKGYLRCSQYQNHSSFLELDQSSFEFKQHKNVLLLLFN